MIEFKSEFEESVVTLLLLWLWVAVIFISLIFGMSRNDGQKQQHLLHGGGVAAAGSDSGRRTNSNGFIPSSFRTLSGYLKIVSSGASTVARSAAASFASSILDKNDDADCNRVIWAGFDTLEGQGEVIRQLLLLGYSSGFQVWDVDDSNNVHDLVSRHDGPVSFMQMVPCPIVLKRPEDKFADKCPLLVVCTDGLLAGGGKIQDGLVATCNGGSLNRHDQGNGNYLPTTVQFYSMRSQSYVHVLKFRSVVYSVRCSSRIVAVSQATQIHCFSATTLEREYTLLTNPIVTGCLGSGGIGFGPLAVGPRWLAYSGSPAATATSGRVSPQHLTPSASFPGFSSNGSLVAHYAKESSKHLAAGIVSLGDMGYKKLSRYCSELLPDGSGSIQSVNSSPKGNRIVNGHSTDVDNIGMVIVRDIVSKNVVAQFRAHKSPISALCFDPSGTILATASVQGHNINVFKIMPGYERVSASDAGPSYVHLYRLQRGLTNAVIQDISFSVDSRWIMISSSRGTSHLFAINPQGGPVNILSYDNNLTEKNGGLGVMTNQAVRWPHNSAVEICKPQSLCATGPPITLSVVSRIRNGSNGWRSTVTGAAAAATNRMSSLSGAIASSFCNFEGSSTLCVNGNYSEEKYHLLVFSPTGSMIQYALQTINSQDSGVVSGLTPAYESAPVTDARVVVEPIQKWNISRRHSWREGEDNIDIYGENGVSDCNKVFAEEVKKDNINGPKIKNVALKVNYSSEKEHNLYISEAELQMHQAYTPLWAKTDVYFHSVGKEATMMMDEEAASGGEFEIEKIPTRVIEARSKDLVPIFDYTQIPKFQQIRTPDVDNKLNEQILHQSSKLFEKGRISPRSFLGPTDCMTNSGGTVTEFKSGIQGNEWNDHLIPAETKSFVNNNNTLKPNTRQEIVNNRREHFNMDAQHVFVNSDRKCLKLENHCEEEDEFD
ncbi:Autophagy-related protein 18f [Spatholobus suberectus]|nr:Autophagy-related protein 18f [Spatholobus suberectus]